ncbi:MAG: WxL domain-containing protein [Microthrixaceae bacterium]
MIATLTIPPADAQIVGLTLIAPTVGDFAPVTMDGTPRTTTAAVSAFTVSDVRVTAEGWRVSVSATQFCEQLLLSTCALDPKTLPLGSLDQSSPTASGPGTAPTMSAAVGIDGSTATLASAAVGTGTGTYSFSGSTLTLRIPAAAYGRTYVSTVTWTITSGP